MSSAEGFKTAYSKSDRKHIHLIRLVVLKSPGFQSQKYGMPTLTRRACDSDSTNMIRAHDWFLVKPVSILFLSFTLSHFQKSSPSLLQEIYLLVLHMPKKWPEMNMHLDLDLMCDMDHASVINESVINNKLLLLLLNLVLFWYFDGFGYYNFYLTRFGVDLIKLLWTSSQFRPSFVTADYCIKKFGWVEIL